MATVLGKLNRFNGDAILAQVMYVLKFDVRSETAEIADVNVAMIQLKMWILVQIYLTIVGVLNKR